MPRSVTIFIPIVVVAALLFFISTRRDNDQVPTDGNSTVVRGRLVEDSSLGEPEAVTSGVVDEETRETRPRAQTSSPLDLYKAMDGSQSGDTKDVIYAKRVLLEQIADNPDLDEAHDTLLDAAAATAFSGADLRNFQFIGRKLNELWSEDPSLVAIATRSFTSTETSRGETLALFHALLPLSSDLLGDRLDDIYDIGDLSSDTLEVFHSSSDEDLRAQLASNAGWLDLEGALSVIDEMVEHRPDEDSKWESMHSAVSSVESALYRYATDDRLLDRVVTVACHEETNETQLRALLATLKERNKKAISRVVKEMEAVEHPLVGVARRYGL